MKKLIAAVEALDRHKPAGYLRPLVRLDDVLRLIREHDPTAAIVRFLGECAVVNDADSLKYKAKHPMRATFAARAQAYRDLADDLKSGKAP